MEYPDIVGSAHSGNGALAAIQEESQLPGYELSRVASSPTRVESTRSASTLSQSPNPEPEEARILRERWEQRMSDWSRSCPTGQFEQQIAEEVPRVLKAQRIEIRHLNHLDMDISPLEIARGIASSIVKTRWRDQGLWDDGWVPRPQNPWKHQKPLQIESDMEIVVEAVPAMRLLKSEDERRRTAERNAARKREHEASRPYHQFIHQMSMMCEQIIEESGERENFAVDISSQAYKTVKATWLRRGIWNVQWGVMPGMSWKSENLWNEPYDLGNDSQVSVTRDIPQEDQSANGEMTGNTCGDVGFPSQLATSRATRGIGQQSSHTGRSSQSRSMTLREPINSSETTETTARKKPGRQREANPSQRASQNDPTLMPDTLQRRSRRIQQRE